MKKIYCFWILIYGCNCFWANNPLPQSLADSINNNLSIKLNKK